MIYGILLIAAVLVIVFIAALLIILWAVPVNLSGRAELCQNRPTLLFGFCAEWGIVSLHARVPDESTVEVSLFGRTFTRVLPETVPTEPPRRKRRKKRKGNRHPISSASRMRCCRRSARFCTKLQSTTCGPPSGSGWVMPP
ncbi:hypothetical protein [Methanogenium cariaci]|uniref:hypothetical protein n=1 Tax=Methanogenium cariaci TaxID=2197 RepID=UPI00078518A3|nr:hypothetical protein [Methanogenium cariaci]